MKGTDISVSKPDGSHKFAVYHPACFPYLIITHTKCPGSKLHSVKFLGKLDQCRVTLGGYTLDNRPRTCLDLRVK
jgi:hypothetical protein